MKTLLLVLAFLVVTADTHAQMAGAGEGLIHKEKGKLKKSMKAPPNHAGVRPPRKSNYE